MRRDDPNDDETWTSSKRILHRDDAWYVATRKGDLGPFPFRQMAVIEWKRYIRKLKLPQP